MNVFLRVGEKIPLTLQLECFDSGLTYYVLAVVKDDDGVLVQNVALTPQGDGYFQDKNLEMPDRPFLSSRYEVYLDAGFTTRADYCESYDLFTKDETETGGPVTLSESFLVGEMADGDLLGEMAADQRLVGEIDISDLSGEIEDQIDLIGEMSGNNLIAELGECA